MDLSDLNPVARARAALLADEALTSMLGAGDQIGVHNTPPYPCIRLDDPPGNDRDARHLIAPIVRIEVLGDPDGSNGRPLLRKILYKAIEVLRDLPTKPVEPGESVVTLVRPSGGGGWSPEPTGQPRYVATVSMHMHPASTPAPEPTPSP